VDYPDLGWVFVGHVRRKQNKLEEAEKAVRTGLKHNPEYVEGHFELGLILVAQQRFADATASFRRVTELDASHGAAYRELANCALVEGNRAEAIRRLIEAVQYMPQDAEAHCELGQLLIQDGRRDEALVHLHHALRLKPDDRRPRELLDKLQPRGGKEVP
jgi:cytochrome c-type biogenesis protein CcmH/NrfG